MKRVRDLGEFGLIDRVAQILGVPSVEVVVGIGDDSAVLRCSQDFLLLFTTDALLEGVHFRQDFSLPEDVGWKTVAVNISDISAMGGMPTFGVLTLGLPSDTPLEWVEGFYRGVAESARAFGVEIVGGDTTASQQGVVINLALLGTVEPECLVLRQGAQIGDLVGVTGTLGDAAAGLALLKAGIQSPEWDRCYRAHRRPLPRLAEARSAVKTRQIHSMIDLSDGLAGDLRRIGQGSGVGAIVEISRIPLSLECQRAAEALGQSPLEWALYGGEDYELLMTFPETSLEVVSQAVYQATGTHLTPIGRIVAEGFRLLWPDGSLEDLSLKGYEHFTS